MPMLICLETFNRENVNCSLISIAWLISGNQQGFQSGRGLTSLHLCSPAPRPPTHPPHPPPPAVCAWPSVLYHPSKISWNHEAFSFLKTSPTWDTFFPLSHFRGRDLNLYSYLFYLLLDRYCNTNMNLFGRVSWREPASSPLADEHFILMFIWCHGNEHELRFTFWT